MGTYVLVHGAWHTGEHLELVADLMREDGHSVHTPTLAGNRPGETKNVGLSEAIDSLVDYVIAHEIEDIVLVGHSYGGMIIAGAAAKLGTRIRRLVFWNAFVPNNGESLMDLVPPHYKAEFERMAIASPDRTVMLSASVWREVFFNDGTAAQAEVIAATLNPQPYRTFDEPIELSLNPAEIPVAKSYLNFTDDTAMPHSLPWHPRLSSKLGLFRLVQAPGGHEVMFTNPKLAASKVIEAGRD